MSNEPQPVSRSSTDAGEPRLLPTCCTLLTAVVGALAVLTLLLPDEVLIAAGFSAEGLAQPLTARESLREGILVIAAATAIGSAILLALFGSMPLLREPVFLLAGLLIALIVHTMGLAQIGYTPDQAFINYVYARNLATHGQLAFNLGERAAGYSSFLLVVLLAPFAYFSTVFDLQVVARGLALVASVPTVSLLYILGRRLAPDRSPTWSLLAPFLLTLFPGYVLSSTMSLETQLVTFLVTLGAYLYLLHPTGKGGWGWPLAFAGAALARGSAVIFLIATLIFEAIAVGRRKESYRGFVVRCLPAVAIVVVCGLWTSLCLGFVSDPAMTGGGWGGCVARLGRGVYYVGSFLTRIAGIILFLIPLAAAVARMKGPQAYAATVAGAGLLCASLTGGESLPGHGLLMPVAPLILYLLQESAASLYERMPQDAPGRATLLHLVLVGALLFAFPVPYVRQEVRLTHEAASLKASAASLRDLAERLRRDPNPRATMAIREPGQVRYISGKTVIDLSGRCDKAIAALGPGAALNVLERQPKYVVLSATAPGVAGRDEHILWPIERNLYQARGFRESYALDRDFTRIEPSDTGQGEYLWLFQRRAN